MNLKVKKRFPDAKLPFRANPTDSGADVFAHSVVKIFKQRLTGENEDVRKNPKIDANGSIVLERGDRVLIDTGLAVTYGAGHEIQVRPRSGLALKQGLTVLNTPGTIDESFRGMLGVILINNSQSRQTLTIGERIAQIVVSPVVPCEIEEVIELDDTERGEGGFGSTGKK